MDLLGGGEGVYNNNSASSGWGTLPPPTSSASSGWGSSSSNSTNQWGSSRQQQNGDQSISTSPKPLSSWAQAAGKGLNNGQLGPNQNSLAGNSGSQPENSTRNNKGDGQIKEAALVSDNWGQSVINQESTWNLPPSPQSSPKESASVWRSGTTAGTEIWENALAKGSSSVANTPSSSNQPWGHTPSTHIGGTWGEDEDSGNNHWTGVPQTTNGGVSNGTTSNWSSNSANNGTNHMWNKGPSTDKHRTNQSSTWGDGGKCLLAGALQTDGTLRSLAEPNEAETGSGNWGGNGNRANKSDTSFGHWSPVPQRKDGGWDSDSADKRSMNIDDGTAVWGNPVRQGKVSHWKESSGAKPGANSANGSSSPQIGTNSGILPASPGMIHLPPGVTPGTTGKSNEAWNKPLQPAAQWNRATWNETGGSRDSPATGWGESGDNKSVPGTPNWGEGGASPLSYWGNNKPKTPSTSSWMEGGQIDTSTWGGPKQGKPLSKDIIWASKQFRILTEMGFKKDDVENALRNNGMVLEDAIVELRANTRENSDLDARSKNSGIISNNPSLLTSGVANSSLTSISSRSPLMNVLPPLQQQPTDPQSCSSVNQINQSALGSQANRVGGAQLNLPSAQQLRHLVQQIQLAVQAGHLNAQILNQPLAPPTLQLLYQLLQQIKMLHQLQISATQATQHLAKSGASNAPAPAIQSSIHVQITQTKQRILNLQNQIAAQQAIFLKQQQQQQPHGAVNNGGHQTTPLHTPQTPTGDFFKAPSDNLLEMSGDRDLGAQAISRFQTNWKCFKDDTNIVTTVAAATVANEFSRAPGSLSKQPSISSASLLTRSDTGNWCGISGEETGWPDSANMNVSNGNQRNDMVSVTTPTSSISSAQVQAQAQQVQSAYNLNDLVPEFEPGKPWKGASLRNIEDDPNVTPGSIARSPLSISTIKDPMLLNWSSKMSPGTTADSLTSLSLSSSTWAFTPPSTTNIYNAADNGNNKQTTVKAGWGTISSESVSNPSNDTLWSGPITKPRGPPPGLSAQIKNPATTTNPTGFWNSDNRASGWDRSGRSTFLLLRNLTPQIDGSTLKTLCMQHGPLQMFHLFLNHGIALAKYSTREEGLKAQSALNNCVLGNTTILADIPSEAEVQQYMQLSNSGQQMASNPLNWSNNGHNGSGGTSQSATAFRNTSVNANAPSNMQFSGTSNTNAAKEPSGSSSSGWNTPVSLGMWSFSNSGNNLWGAPTLSNAHDRNIPSSIQNLLPGDLLGGETN